MNPSFNIKSTTAADGTHLFVFAGGQSFSLAVLNANHVFTAIVVYNFEQGIAAADRYALLQKIVAKDDIASQFYDRKDIIWCTEQSILTPQSFFERESSAGMLNMVYGDAAIYTVKSEVSLKHQLYNAYRINTDTEKLISEKFSTATQWHQSTLILNFAAEKDNLLYCNFTPGSITVMLRTQKQLQAVQIMEYGTAADAAFHLLNICSCYNIAAAQVSVIASGMIDESSNLYTELHKYFLSIEFLQLPDVFEYSDEIKNYPAHYFSHLFTTAACVL